jgi:hypothetical protein
MLTLIVGETSHYAIILVSSQPPWGLSPSSWTAGQPEIGGRQSQLSDPVLAVIICHRLATSI